MRSTRARKSTTFSRDGRPGRLRRTHCQGNEQRAEQGPQLLQVLCKSYCGDEPERLVVIPGNHDYRYKGFGWRTSSARFAFHDLCGQSMKHRFYPKLNLLVACFDSNVGSDRFELAAAMSMSGNSRSLPGGWKPMWRPMVMLCPRHTDWRSCITTHCPSPKPRTSLHGLLERLAGRKLRRSRRLDAAEEFRGLCPLSG